MRPYHILLDPLDNGSVGSHVNHGHNLPGEQVNLFVYPPLRHSEDSALTRHALNVLSTRSGRSRRRKRNM